MFKMLYGVSDVKEIKRIFKNSLYLFSVQGVNYLLTFLTIPYLVRIIGIDNFGVIAFATSIMAYFILIIDYGFNLSATRQISINASDVISQNKIYTSITFIKLILSIVCLSIIILLICSFDKFYEYKVIYIYATICAMCQVLYTNWLYQGHEDMKFMSVINILSRILYVIAIFCLIKTKDDFVYILLINAISLMVFGIISQIIIRKKYNIKFVNCNIKDIRKQLTEGWYVFYSSVSSSLYTTSATFILGMNSSYTTVGYFSAADKIIQATKGIYFPISQAFYPFFSRAFIENPDQAIKYYKINVLFSATLMFSISVLIFIFSKNIVGLIYGNDFNETVHILQIMAFIPVVVTISNVFGVQGLLASGNKKIFSKIIGFASVFGVTSIIILSYFFSGYGTGIAVAITETIISIIFIYSFLIYFKKGKICKQ